MNLLEDCRVLCFDEFHVHDIGDAMLITRLFKALFERGVLVLVTSNYAPAGLLPNPLYHQRFKPVIELIDARMDVMEVNAPQDYRGLAQNHDQQRFTQGRFVCPGSPAQRQALGLPAADCAALSLTVGTRQLRVRGHEGRTIAFTFNDLCEQPTAVLDYLLLCDDFDHWIIDGLPELAECPIAVQQRFINLVDALYDKDKHLILIGEQPLAHALRGQAIDLSRTRQSPGAIATEPTRNRYHGRRLRPHRPETAPFMHTLAQLKAGQLAGITRLDLSCGLTEFPREIFALADSLEILNLSGNALSHLPEDLHRLPHLRVLFCSDNGFTELPRMPGPVRQR